MQMFGEIPDFLIVWLEKQQMFWVASAPLTLDGLVNISPKGVEGTFHIANPRRVWYEDLSGSGVETISHIRENGRVTILFNAFEGPPRIVRLYGKGSVFEFGTSDYNTLLPEGIRHPGSRAVIVLDIFKVATTCGYSVPFYDFKGHRTQLLEWAAKKEAADRDTELTVGFSSATGPRVQTGLKRWWEERNTTSLDGLQGIVSAHMSDEIFRSRRIAKKSPFQTATIQSKMIRTFDFRILCAFLFGILVTCIYQRLALVTSYFIFIN
ncbi:hypothetical protein E4T56_gene18467 [Termitomyces sp. T112]|nr:hypothetical protein E4T56_gene18467 [Termitomyces sp. T112]